MKPTIPQGTRDFGPDVVRKRNYIFNTIKTVFELYGYQPIETPAMENLDTLMGKYGEEGDKLIFRILNNGLDNPDKQNKAREEFEKVLQGTNTTVLTERALKYDLTIPFARYVAMNHGQLSYPFKRYQVQPVWRADRPQKGRYREFYQCDADVVGSNSLLNEVELIRIYQEVFKKLGLQGNEIHINHRKILTALAEICGGQLTTITTTIDKLDKIGIEKVKEELKKNNLSDKQVSIVETYLAIDGSNEQKISKLKSLLGTSLAGEEGIKDIQYILDAIKAAEGDPLTFDPALARGLNYYTGAIIEASAPSSVKMGSIGGGGRYDDLTGLFGVAGIPGVGISFGVDRIYDVLEELNLFPENLQVSTQVLFFNLGEVECRAALGLAQELRGRNIRCEVYPDQVKFDKQFKYAERKNIPYVAIIGSEELGKKNCTIKDIRTSEQQTISFNKLADFPF